MDGIQRVLAGSPCRSQGAVRPGDSARSRRVSYYHHDQQGSTRLTTSPTGAIISTTTYDPYGNRTSATGPQPVLGYDGQYQDPNTGFIYLRARWYDPSSAQFLTQDPLQAITGEPYAYANDNPFDRADPTGLFSIFGYQVGFHPVAGLEGGANFLAGLTNAVVSTVTLGNVTIPQPFCGGLLDTSYGIGGVTAGVEAGVATGAGVASGARTLLNGVLVGGVKVAPILAPLAGGAGGAIVQGAVQGDKPSAGATGKGVAGGLGGELFTGFSPGTTATVTRRLAGLGRLRVWRGNGMTETTETPETRVMASRLRSLGFALFLGLITFTAAARAIAAHSMSGLLVTLLFVGVPCAGFVRWGTRQRPVLVIDDHALTVGRSRRVVPWDSVTAIRVGTKQGIFGETHHLVLTLAHDGPEVLRRFITTSATNQSEVDISLDWLAMPWKDVVSIVQQRFGRRVTATSERPFRSG